MLSKTVKVSMIQDFPISLRRIRLDLDRNIREFLHQDAEPASTFHLGERRRETLVVLVVRRIRDELGDRLVDLVPVSGPSEDLSSELASVELVLPDGLVHVDELVRVSLEFFRIDCVVKLKSDGRGKVTVPFKPVRQLAGPISDRPDGDA